MSAAGTTTAGAAGVAAVDAYVASLGAAVHGPRGVKDRLLGELRADLLDAVEAGVGSGLPEAVAVERALRASGAPARLAPDWQAELGVVQARTTALALGGKVAVLVALWHLVGRSEPATLQAVPRPVAVLALHLGGLAALVGVLALLLGFVGGRAGLLLDRSPRLPAVMAAAGRIAASAAALATGAVVAAVPRTVTAPPGVAGAVLSVLLVAAMLRSARRCRRCAPAALPEQSVLGRA